MEGFHPEPTIYNLNFDDIEDLRGLRIRMKGCSIAEYNRMLMYSSSGATTKETVLNNEKLSALFVSKLVSWNLQDDQGDPVPSTVEGLESQDSRQVTRIMAMWMMAMVGVSSPLQNGSVNGEISGEAGLGLVSESQSPPSWPAQS